MSNTDTPLLACFDEAARECRERVSDDDYRGGLMRSDVVMLGVEKYLAHPTTDVSTDGLVERDLRFFSCSALMELTPSQLEEWAGASWRAIDRIEALQRSNAEKDEALRKIRSLIPKHIAAWGSEQEIADICDEALSHSSETSNG